VTPDHRDIVIEHLALSEAELIDDLREVKRQLIDLVADLAVENNSLRILYQHELQLRLLNEGTIACLRRVLDRQRAA